MSKSRFTRGRLLAGAAPFALAPILGKVAFGGSAEAAKPDPHALMHDAMSEEAGLPVDHASMSGHTAMIGAEVPAVGEPGDLDALTYPPPALPYKPGRV